MNVISKLMRKFNHDPLHGLSGHEKRIPHVNDAANKTTPGALLQNEMNTEYINRFKQSLDNFGQLVENFKQHSSAQPTDEHLKDFQEEINELTRHHKAYDAEHKKINFGYELTKESQNKLVGKNIKTHNPIPHDIGSEDTDENPIRVLKTEDTNFIQENNLSGFINFINSHNMNSLPQHVKIFCDAVTQSIVSGEGIVISNDQLKGIVNELIDNGDESSKEKKEAMNGLFRYESVNSKDYNFSIDPAKDALLKTIIDTVNASGQYKIGISDVKQGVVHTKIETIFDLQKALNDTINKDLVMHLRANIEDNDAISFSSSYRAPELTLETRSPVSKEKQLKMCLDHYARRGLNGRADEKHIKEYFKTLKVDGLTEKQIEQMHKEKGLNYNHADIYNTNSSQLFEKVLVSLKGKTFDSDQNIIRKIVDHFVQDVDKKESLIRYGDQYYTISTNREDQTFNLTHLNRDAVKNVLREPNAGMPYLNLSFNDETRVSIPMSMKSGNGMGGIHKQYMSSSGHIIESFDRMMKHIQNPKVSKEHAVSCLVGFVERLHHDIETVRNINDRHKGSIGDFKENVNQSHSNHLLGDLQHKGSDERSSKLFNLLNHIEEKQLLQAALAKVEQARSQLQLTGRISPEAA